MPTESQYRSAAEEFRMRARTHRDRVAWTPRRPSTRFTGDGPVAESVDDGHDRVLRLLLDAAGRLDAVARECEQRAAVCAAYRRDLARYHALPLHLRERAVRPVRPAVWVDA